MRSSIEEHFFSHGSLACVWDYEEIYTGAVSWLSLLGPYWVIWFIAFLVIFIVISWSQVSTSSQRAYLDPHNFLLRTCKSGLSLRWPSFPHVQGRLLTLGSCLIAGKCFSIPRQGWVSSSLVPGFLQGIQFQFPAVPGSVDHWCQHSHP